MLNILYRKLLFKNNTSFAQLSFHIQRIISPGKDMDSSHNVTLKNIIAKFRSKEPVCLTVGLNMNLPKFMEIFPHLKPNGACLSPTNTIILCRDTLDNPVPMALNFAIYLKSVNSALGATNGDDKCNNGSVPNPMLQIEEYYLTKEIHPDNSSGLFSQCNVQDIERSLPTKSCLRKFNHTACGNAEDGEQCDCGPGCLSPTPLFQNREDDSMDNKTSDLRSGAECSSSDPCCKDCQIVKKGSHADVLHVNYTKHRINDRIPKQEQQEKLEIQSTHTYLKDVKNQAPEIKFHHRKKPFHYRPTKREVILKRRSSFTVRQYSSVLKEKNGYSHLHRKIAVSPRKREWSKRASDDIVYLRIANTPIDRKIDVQDSILLQIRDILHNIDGKIPAPVEEQTDVLKGFEDKDVILKEKFLDLLRRVHENNFKSDQNSTYTSKKPVQGKGTEWFNFILATITVLGLILYFVHPLLIVYLIKRRNKVASKAKDLEKVLPHRSHRLMKRRDQRVTTAAPKYEIRCN